MSTNDRSIEDSDVQRIEYKTPRDLTLQLKVAVGDDPTQTDSENAVLGSRTQRVNVANVEAIEYHGSSKPWYTLIVETTHDQQRLDRVLDIIEPDEPRRLLPRALDGRDAPTVAEKMYFGDEVDEDTYVR